jgi:hypothetical protein
MTQLDGESLDELADPLKVAVAYGRDDAARQALFGFLRALGLQPLEWEALIAATRTASPYTGQAVEAGFAQARAVVVMFTPDDVVRLHPDLDQRSFVVLQSRPNVLVEAGMALATHPDRTVLTILGPVELPSNLAGRNFVRLDTSQGLNTLASRLQRAGCSVSRDGSDWLDWSRFARLAALTRTVPSGESASADGAEVKDLAYGVRAAADRADVSLTPRQVSSFTELLTASAQPFDAFHVASVLPAPGVPSGAVARILRELLLADWVRQVADGRFVRHGLHGRPEP